MQQKLKKKTQIYNKILDYGLDELLLVKEITQYK